MRRSISANVKDRKLVHERRQQLVHPALRLSRALHILVGAMHDHQETVLLVYRESHALDRHSLHAILARAAEFIDMFEHILVEAARSGQVRLGDRRVAANILTFLSIIVAMRRWDLGRRGVARKDLDHDLVHFMLSGLGFNVASGNAHPASR